MHVTERQSSVFMEYLTNKHFTRFCIHLPQLERVQQDSFFSVATSNLIPHVALHCIQYLFTMKDMDVLQFQEELYRLQKEIQEVKQVYDTRDVNSNLLESLHLQLGQLSGTMKDLKKDGEILTRKAEAIEVEIKQLQCGNRIYNDMIPPTPVMSEQVVLRKSESKVPLIEDEESKFQLGGSPLLDEMAERLDERIKRTEKVRNISLLANKMLDWFRS